MQGFGGAPSSISAIDTTLRRMGYSNPYIASTISDRLDTLVEISQGFLSKVDASDNNLSDIVKTMNSVMAHTGVEGPSLAALQRAATGSSLSQDPVTRAIAMRAARMSLIDRGLPADFVDVNAELEAPNSATMERIYASTLRNEALYKGNGIDRTQAVMSIMRMNPGMSYNQAIEMFNGIVSSVPGGKKYTELTEEDIMRGVHNYFNFAGRGEDYSDAQAAAMTSPMERSIAGTANRTIFNGTDLILQKMGTSMVDAIKTAASDIVFKVKIIGGGVATPNGFIYQTQNGPTEFRDPQLSFPGMVEQVQVEE